MSGDRSDVYLAWNGREYPMPPPTGWERRSDGRYWPATAGVGGTAGSRLPAVGTSFGPQHGATGSVFADSASLPWPSVQDRWGSLPMRRRSYLALFVGLFLAATSLQFISMDILGFTVEQQDFVGLDQDEGPGFAPLGEERELSPEATDDLIQITSCTNDGSEVRAEGTALNRLDGERTYSITMQFFVVGGERLLDGFSEVTVPPGVSVSFFAVSASPSVDGAVVCDVGSVIRFIAE